MEILLDAEVECSDGPCGRAVYVLVNPITNKVTHLVVRENESHVEYIVPVEIVSDASSEKIMLNRNKAQFELLQPFIKTHFIETKVPRKIFDTGSGTYSPDTYYYFPYVTPQSTMQLPVEEKQVPPDELAVHRGARVEASDGRVGRVDEFVVEPEHGYITHLVLREGRLWGQKDVIVPASAIDEIQEDAVILKLDKQQVEALPFFPIRREWM